MEPKIFTDTHLKWKHSMTVLTLISVILLTVSCTTSSQEKSASEKEKGNKKGFLEGVPYKMRDHITPTNFSEKDWIQFHEKNNSNAITSGTQTSQWKQINFVVDHTAGSYGAHGIGVIRSIAIQPGNTNTVIAGTLLSGLWLTTDKGLNWIPVGQSVPLVETIWEVKFAPSNPNIVYAITNVGLIKSTDSGLTWKYTTNFLSTLPYTAKETMLDISPTDSNKVFVCVKNVSSSNGGIYLTTNGGTSWSTLQEGNAYWDIKINPGNSAIVYAIQQISSPNWWTKFLRSTDSGVTFTEINSGYPSTHIAGRQLYRGAIAVSPAAPDYVYVYSAGNDEYGFWKSTDAGLNFAKQDQGWAGNTTLSIVPPGTDYTFDGKLTAGYGQTSWDFAVAVSSTNPNLVYAGCNKTMFSTDGGTSWSHVGNPNQITWPIHGDIQGIDASGNEVWIVSDGGAYYSSNNGATAISKYDGLYAQECWGFSQGFKSDIMAAGINHNAIYIRDESLYSQWLTGPGADAQTATVNPLDDRYIYAMPWWDVRLTRSTARNTPPGNTGNLGVYSGYVNFQNYIIHPNLYNKIYVVGHSQPLRPELVTGVAVSDDNASSWSSLKDFADISRTGGRMQISFADANTMFAIINRDNLPYQLWKTNNGGVSWSDVSPTSMLTSEFTIRNIALSESDVNKAWMILGSPTNVKVLQTTDGGLTWTDYSTGLPNSEGRFGIVNQRGTNGGVYIGTRMGVYYRNVSMSSWVLHGTGILGGEINFLQINYAKGKIRAAGTRGIWENDLYESFNPDANFAADKNYVDQSGGSMAIQFKDHSALTQAGATWSWSFRGGTPSTSIDENPLISYANASSGKHSVTLTVTDTAGNTSTKTIRDFIEVNNRCTTIGIPIPNVGYSIHGFDSQEIVSENAPASNAIDGKNETFWVTQWMSPTAPMPHYISVNLGNTYNFKKLTYTPRQDNQNGRINDYQVHTSMDGVKWVQAASGKFNNSTTTQDIILANAVTATYVKLTATSEVNGNPWAAIGELKFYEECPTISCEKENIPRSRYSIYEDNNQKTGGKNTPASNAIDGNKRTSWITKWTNPTAQMPYAISIDLSTSHDLSEIHYTPRQDNQNGRINDYQVHISVNGINWTQVASGNFINSTKLQKVTFTQPMVARYVKITALSEVNGNPWIAIGELSFVGCDELEFSNNDDDDEDDEDDDSSVKYTNRMSDEKKEDMLAFPIPAKNSLSIRVPNLKGKSIVASLTDLSGQQLREMCLKNNENIVTIDVQGLLPGIYVINLIDETGKRYQQKIIKK